MANTTGLSFSWVCKTGINLREIDAMTYQAAHHTLEQTNDASKTYFHGVNNYFQNIDGHAFDVNTWVLLEGTYFDNVKTPMTSGSLTSGAFMYKTATVAVSVNCFSSLGYICEWNRKSGSVSWPDGTDSATLTAFANYKKYLIGHTGVANVPSDATAHAGIGKI